MRRLAVIVLLAFGCHHAAAPRAPANRPDAPPKPPVAGPVTVTAAPTAGNPGALAITARFAGAVHVGQPAVMELSVEPRDNGDMPGTSRLNHLFPTHLTVEPTPRAAIENASIQMHESEPSPDVDWADGLATFHVRLTPEVAGPLPLKAVLRFSTCTDELCTAYAYNLTWTLDVAE